MLPSSLEAQQNQTKYILNSSINNVVRLQHMFSTLTSVDYSSLHIIQNKSHKHADFQFFVCKIFVCLASTFRADLRSITVFSFTSLSNIKGTV